MTMQLQPDRLWTQLLESPAAERERQMQRRYEQLAALSEEQRRQQLLAMAKAEYSLPDDKLREFSLSRMRVVLRMNMDQAKTVLASYNVAMEQMPGTAAMRRVAIVQTLAREFPLEDQEKLRVLVPRMFTDRPATLSAAAPPPAPPPAPAAPGKSRWAFWKKN